MRPVLGLIVLLLLLESQASGAPPPPLWVAPLDGRDANALESAGVVIRDRLPDAVILDDAAAAARLRTDGLRVAGPLSVPAGHEVFLLRPRRGATLPVAGLTAARLERPGVPRVLWIEGDAALVTTDRPLPEDGIYAELSPKILAAPMSASRYRTVPAPLVGHSFDPRVGPIVADIDSAAYFPWIRRLTGAEPVSVGGETVLFTTRHTNTPMGEKAEQYVFERFRAMGYTDVVYDPFSVAGTSGRNVIAALPGVQRPGRVVLVCGHLDSTARQGPAVAPGANDNASGTAAVLCAAEAMRDWPFRATVRFVAFTGEEQGLLGAEHYAAAVAASPDTVIAVLNADMIAWWYVRRQIDIQGNERSRAVMQVMAAACRAFTDVVPNVRFSTCCSDHVPFLQRGIPGFLAIESDYFAYPCYHEPCDTAALNLGGFGADVARAITATAAQIAGPLDPAEFARVVPSASVPAASGRATPARPAPARSSSLAVMPNPFGDVVTIRVTGASGAERLVTIHDVSGRRIRALRAATSGGEAQLVWDGRDESGAAVPAGIYFVRMTAGEQAAATKLIRIADR